MPGKSAHTVLVTTQVTSIIESINKINEKLNFRYNIISCKTIETALIKAKQNEIDIILLDSMLIPKTGETIKTQDYFSDTPIIALVNEINSQLLEQLSNSPLFLEVSFTSENTLFLLLNRLETLLVKEKKLKQLSRQAQQIEVITKQINRDFSSVINIFDKATEPKHKETTWSTLFNKIADLFDSTFFMEFIKTTITTLFDAPFGLILVDSDGNILHYNLAVLHLLEQNSKNFRNQNFISLINQISETSIFSSGSVEDLTTESGIISLLTKNEQRKYIEIEAKFRNSGKQYYELWLTDVSTQVDIMLNYEIVQQENAENEEKYNHFLNQAISNLSYSVNDYDSFIKLFKSPKSLSAQKSLLNTIELCRQCLHLNLNDLNSYRATQSWAPPLRFYPIKTELLFRVFSERLCPKNTRLIFSKEKDLPQFFISNELEILDILNQLIDYIFKDYNKILYLYSKKYNSKIFFGISNFIMEAGNNDIEKMDNSNPNGQISHIPAAICEKAIRLKSQTGFLKKAPDEALFYLAIPLNSGAESGFNSIKNGNWHRNKNSRLNKTLVMWGNDFITNSLVREYGLLHGWSTIEVGTRAEFKATLFLSYADLIIIDLTTNISDSGEIIEKLKKNSYHQHIPIIALINHAVSDDYQYDEVFFIKKPLEIQKLTLILDKLLLVDIWT